MIYNCIVIDSSKRVGMISFRTYMDWCFPKVLHEVYYKNQIEVCDIKCSLFFTEIGKSIKVSFVTPHGSRCEEFHMGDIINVFR